MRNGAWDLEASSVPSKLQCWGVVGVNRKRERIFAASVILGNDGTSREDGEESTEHGINLKKFLE
jgi:hypothetical protein